MSRMGLSATKYHGRMILRAEMREERLALDFTDGSKIEIFDNAELCCERRYMRTDDDLSSLVGGRLTRIEAKDAPNERDTYGEHEVVFVEIATDKGFVTVANHNEHNGYYGGFGLTVHEVAPEAGDSISPRLEAP